MNKFVVVNCINMDQDESVDYDGIAVALANTANPSFVLFFPINQENASVINSIMRNRKEGKTIADINTSVLDVYKTMLDSWLAGDHFLSGILVEVSYSEEFQEEVIAAKITLSSIKSGRVEGVVKINFIHAILLAAIENLEIIVSEEILDKLVPERPDEDEENEDGEEGEEDEEGTVDTKKPSRNNKDKKDASKYPIDKDILETARKIMNGKIK